MEKYFALYDSDLFYTTRFMEFLKKMKDFHFEISVFTKVESLKEFLMDKQVEILLLGDPYSIEELPKDKIRYIYLLTEDKRAGKALDYPYIFKYQPAAEVIREILSDYERKEDTSRVILNSNPGKIISLFAPEAGFADLAFTWSLSTLLSDNNKVLLVLLDLLPVQLIDTISNRTSSLTEFIYYLKENSDIIIKMKSLLKISNNLSVLGGLAHGADILALNKEDIQKWITALKKNTDYHRIIFYLSNCTDSLTEFLNVSDEVIVTTKNSLYEEAVIKEWQRQMECMQINTHTDKFKYTRLANEELQQLPISWNELAHCSAWEEALKYINN